MRKVLALLAALAAAPAAQAQTCPAGPCAFDDPITTRLVSGSTVAGIGQGLLRYLDYCHSAAYDSGTKTFALTCQKGATTAGGDPTTQQVSIDVDDEALSQSLRNRINQSTDNDSVDLSDDGRNLELYDHTGSEHTVDLRPAVRAFTDPLDTRVDVLELTDQALHSSTTLVTRARVVFQRTNTAYALTGAADVPAAQVGRKIIVVITDDIAPDVRISFALADLLAKGTVTRDNTPIGDTNALRFQVGDDVYWIGRDSSNDWYVGSSEADAQLAHYVTITDYSLDVEGYALRSQPTARLPASRLPASPPPGWGGGGGGGLTDDQVDVRIHEHPDVEAALYTDTVMEVRRRLTAIANPTVSVTIAAGATSTYVRIPSSTSPTFGILVPDDEAVAQKETVIVEIRASSGVTPTTVRVPAAHLRQAGNRGTVGGAVGSSGVSFTNGTIRFTLASVVPAVSPRIVREEILLAADTAGTYTVAVFAGRADVTRLVNGSESAAADAVGMNVNVFPTEIFDENGDSEGFQLIGNVELTQTYTPAAKSATLSLATGNTVTVAGATTSTAGLMVDTDKLKAERYPATCSADGQVPKWATSTSTFACGTDERGTGGGGTGDTLIARSANPTTGLTDEQITNVGGELRVRVPSGEARNVLYCDVSDTYTGRAAPYRGCVKDGITAEYDPVEDVGNTHPLFQFTLPSGITAATVYVIANIGGQVTYSESARVGSTQVWRSGADDAQATAAAGSSATFQFFSNTGYSTPLNVHGAVERFEDLVAKTMHDKSLGLTDEEVKDDLLAGKELQIVTRSAYDALSTKDPDTVYLTTGDASAVYRHHTSLSTLPTSGMTVGELHQVTEGTGSTASVTRFVAISATQLKCVGGISADLINRNIGTPSGGSGGSPVSVGASRVWVRIPVSGSSAPWEAWDYRFPAYLVSFGGINNTAAPWFYDRTWYTIDANTVQSLTAANAGGTQATGQFIEIARPIAAAVSGGNITRWRVVALGRTASHDVLINLHSATGSTALQAYPFRMRGSCG